ncbi:MAG: hypothetical protein AAGD10_18335 [Myxococcota bacterium]
MSSLGRGVFWGLSLFLGQLLLGALASWPILSNAVLSGACFAIPQVVFLRWRRRNLEETLPLPWIHEAPEALSSPRGSSTC